MMKILRCGYFYATIITKLDNIAKVNYDDRFVIIEQGSNSLDTRILVDKQTGVNYLVCKTTNGLGITPLLNCEGKVIIDLDIIEREGY